MKGDFVSAIFRMIRLALFALCFGQGLLLADHLYQFPVDSSFLESIPLEQQALVGEYAAAQFALEEQYQNFSLTAVYRIETASSPNEELRLRRSFKGSLAVRSGNHFRVEGELRGVPGVILVNPDEAFVFGRKAQSNAWFLVPRLPPQSSYVNEYMSLYRFDRDAVTNSYFFPACVWKNEPPGTNHATGTYRNRRGESGDGDSRHADHRNQPKRSSMDRFLPNGVFASIRLGNERMALGGS